jgi:hypothetical protein
MHGLMKSGGPIPSSVSLQFVVNCFLTCSVAADIQTMLEETQLKFEEERYLVFEPLNFPPLTY